jgi:hypothetical protein
MGRRKNFVMGDFTLSNDHIDLSKIVGLGEAELVEDYLTNLEVDLKLKPSILIIYYAEQLKGYRRYWYTEGTNVSYIRSFETKLFSFDKSFYSLNN